MNESKWQTGVEGDEMFDFVADRLSPRHWVFLSAAYVRKLWDLLPEGLLRQAVDFAERATHPLSEAERAEWMKKIDAAVPQEVGAAELAQRGIVKSCDPDAADLEQPILAKPNQIAPAFPLFQGAEPQCPQRHRDDRHRGHRGGTGRSRTVRRTQRGDARTHPQSRRSGDRGTPHVRESRREQRLANEARGRRTRRPRRVVEERTNRGVDRHREGAADQGGHPPALGDGRVRSRGTARTRRAQSAGRFLARGRRQPVQAAALRGIVAHHHRRATRAESIFDERAYDRTIILADALLDADCDEEAVLRHLAARNSA